jgi:hypothetical protein
MLLRLSWNDQSNYGLQADVIISCDHRGALHMSVVASRRIMRYTALLRHQNIVPFSGEKFCNSQFEVIL